jgi:peptidoglycan/xylan/chitin deacetylase (PgdA/CDA1 family)
MRAVGDGETAPAPAQAPWPIVLYFHHVGPKLPHYTSISVRQFAYVLELLEQYCDVLPASVLVDSRPTPTYDPSVVLSFDDGYAETLSSVIPLLSERGLTAAFFVVTSEIGKELSHTSLDVRQRRAAWTELRAVSAMGHVIGSHGHYHEPLTEITHRTRAELAHSQQILSAQLGCRYDLLAFPYGVIPSNLEALGISRAFSTGKAPPRHWDCAPRAIRRVYLDSNDESGWAQEVRSWTPRWRGASCSVCRRDAYPT